MPDSDSLHGMRERIALLGGELEIESAPRSGTTLFVHIPDAVRGRLGTFTQRSGETESSAPR